jgi:protocatechuate 3,4-dioxygenase beta subunit
LTDLPAAQYTVTAARSGYLSLHYGQRRPLEQGRPLVLAEKQVVDNVDFSLPRMSVIAGRITDDLGEPIEGVTVMAMRSRYWDGTRQLVPTGQGFVQTNDVGEYRILGLAPGTYYVQAQTKETWAVTQNGVSHVLGYAPTYFPGTAVVSDARRVTVALGREASATDISLVVGRAATVSGTALDSQGRPFPNVGLREEIRGENFARFGGNKSSAVAADGSFTIRDVPPGDYKLAASTGNGSDHPEVAVVPITVEDGVDLTNVSLTGSGGGTMTGHVVTDTGEVPTIPMLRLTIGLPLVGQPDPMLLGAFRTPGSAQVAADGSFSIPGVFGRSRLRVNVPDDWMVKTIMHDGQNITDAPIELKSGEAMADVQIVLTNHVSTVAGRLADDKGAPLADGTVLVFSTDAERWATDSRAVRAARPDQQGQYHIKGLPPGDYLAIALAYVEDGMWNDPEYLQSLREGAQRFSLGEAGTQTLTLKLVTTTP